jgi:membrane-associated phospholipid phosphatase
VRSPKTISGVIFILIFVLSSAAYADEDTNHSPYTVYPEYEIPITLTLFAGTGMSRLFAGEMPSVHCGLECDPNNVNALDRTTIGVYYTDARTISDIFFVSGMFLPYGFDALDVATSDPSDGWEGYGKDVLVLAETMVLTLSLNNILDLSVRRPRPIVYDSENFTDEERLDPASAFSFPSGHTAAVFAMATAYSRLYMQKHPNSPGVVPIWIGTYSIGIGTAVARVMAGEHFITDVFAGAALGTGMGLLVPWLHETNEKNNEVSWKVSPLGVNQGGGALFSMRL